MVIVLGLVKILFVRNLLNHLVRVAATVWHLNVRFDLLNLSLQNVVRVHCRLHHARVHGLLGNLLCRIFDWTIISVVTLLVTTEACHVLSLWELSRVSLKDLR